MPMTSPDNDLWQQCWKDRQIDFHQLRVNELLVRFWPRLGLAPGSRVFVPLCGKSLDMLWLRQQGYQVVGVELSPLAVEAFFRENRLPARRRELGSLSCWESGDLSLFCGDFFALTQAELGPVDAVYDRAALTALPEAVRPAYLAHLGRIVPPSCDIFLLTTEDLESGESHAAHQETAEEITSLYATVFHIELSHVENALETDPMDPNAAPIPVAHKVYHLRPR